MKAPFFWEKVPKMAAAEASAEDVDAMEAPRQSLLEVVQEKLAEKGLVRLSTTPKPGCSAPPTLLRSFAASHPRTPTRFKRLRPSLTCLPFLPGLSPSRLPPHARFGPNLKILRPPPPAPHTSRKTSRPERTEHARPR